MLNAKTTAKIERAIVRLTKQDGRGVLVPGGLILTAAHCIKWNGTGGMTLGDFFIEDIETSDGRKLKATPLAVEVISDIAILGALDGWEFANEADEFATFCQSTSPVPLNTQAIKPKYIPNKMRPSSMGKRIVLPKLRERPPTQAIVFSHNKEQIVDVATERIRHELFDDGQEDALVQGLLAPFADISTSSEALATDESQAESDEDEEGAES